MYLGATTPLYFLGAGAVRLEAGRPASEVMGMIGRVRSGRQRAVVAVAAVGVVLAALGELSSRAQAAGSNPGFGLCEAAHGIERTATARAAVATAGAPSLI